jgi:hypothetical protein
VHVVERTDETCKIVCTVVDLQTNNRQAAEAEFDLIVQRKVRDPETGLTETRWVPADERDARELINKQAALLERNCTLKLIPSDLVDDCCTVARGGDADRLGKAPKASEAARAFTALGVLEADLVAFVGRPITQWDAADVSRLRRIWRSIQDGEAQLSDYFEAHQDQAPEEETRMDGLRREAEAKVRESESKPDAEDRETAQPEDAEEDPFPDHGEQADRPPPAAIEAAESASTLTAPARP